MEIENVRNQFNAETYDSLTMKFSCHLIEKSKRIGRYIGISPQDVLTYFIYYVLTRFQGQNEILLLIKEKKGDFHLNLKIDQNWLLWQYMLNMQEHTLNLECEKEDYQNGQIFVLLSQKDYMNLKEQLEGSLFITYHKSLDEWNIYYHKLLYDSFMIQSLANSISMILETADLNSKLYDIKIVPDVFKQKIMKRSTTNVEYIPEWLFFISQKQKNKVALLTDDEEITYQRFYHEVYSMNYGLSRHLVKENVIVAVMMPRSVELMISIYGILTVGAVCVVVDPGLPEDRINFMLKESNASYLLTSKSEVYSCWDVVVLQYELLMEMVSDMVSNGQPLAIRPQFIVFSSGSTGNPKGIFLEEKGIINHIQTKIQEGGLTHNDIFCLNLGISFVASIWLMLAPLMLGASLFLVRDELCSDPLNFFRMIIQKRITVLSLIPSFLDAYLQMPEQLDIDENGLRVIFVTGEAIQPQTVALFYPKYNIQLINAYGQSECTDDTLHYHITKNQKFMYVPAGLPAINTKAYILDGQMQLQPPGFLGTIYICGDGVAKYCNGQSIPTESVVGEGFHEKVYNTGDKGFYDMDGNVVFAGRQDRMVKKNGCKFFLQELEQKAMQMQSVKQAAAVVDCNNRIILFVTTKKSVSISSILTELSRILPKYMMPHQIQIIENMPRNVSGKIDFPLLEGRLEIPRQKMDRLDDGLPGKIKLLYSSIFHTNIEVTDNLLLHAADSLKFAVFLAQINSEYGVRITIEDMMEEPTILHISKAISKKL